MPTFFLFKIMSVFSNLFSKILFFVLGVPFCINTEKIIKKVNKKLEKKIKVSYQEILII